MIFRLQAELRNARGGVTVFEEKAENETMTLQRIAEHDYFDEDEFLGTSRSVSEGTFSLVTGKSGQGPLQGRAGNAREKDARMADLEKSLYGSARPSPTAGTKWSWRWPGARRQAAGDDDDDDHSMFSHGSSVTCTTGRGSIS